MNLPLRPRRLRRTENVRRMVRETRLTTDGLVLPLFVTYGKKKRVPIDSMPGIYQLSVDQIKKEVKEIAELQIPAILLFGIPEKKDATGSASCADDGIIQEAIREIKSVNQDICVITDVCLCEYTDHGHCGPIVNGQVDNDATLEILQQQALSHVSAGADMVAPSGMMDGMVGAIRDTLDENHFDQLPIMSYAVKYASAFYGPFRDAAQCAPQFGDRKSYQMDSANSREALKEAQLDIDEGADILMVKPALCYLDIIKSLKDACDYPIAAYNVSGEYAMVKAAAKNGWIDEQKIMMEMLTSIKRAGADIIITYFAKDAARTLSR